VTVCAIYFSGMAITALSLWQREVQIHVRIIGAIVRSAELETEMNRCGNKHPVPHIIISAWLDCAHPTLDLVFQTIARIFAVEGLCMPALL
jgi:hypothetical protein